ncbi:MAG: DUF4007 family protein [Pseudomonadota bacterium]|nr:DUF4007 family protein [Pseudomonadota bacterium]
MKFGGHETFHLRDNWLFKGMHMLAKQGDLFSSRDEAIALLGVGTNMVKSIRYWLLATEFAKVVDGQLSSGHIGKLMMTRDPYCDWLGSAWLLHYFLACNKSHATTWFWFFNKFGVSEFTTESAVHYLESYCTLNDKKVNRNTLVKDINTLLRMYVEPAFEGRKTPEDIDICPLTRLSLIDKGVDNTYRLRAPDSDELPVEIFGYTLVQFWTHQLEQSIQFSFDELLKRDCSPTKVFCLNTDQTINLLNRLVEKFPRWFSYKHTGGFFSIEISTKVRGEKLLDRYYGKAN